ncbi:MAG TPA: class I SAM-dependent methyltransferase [Chlamydiales bacterium]|nr:class I SAM-dependent methyltransferase [Chlamydiales bacterium]
MNFSPRSPHLAYTHFLWKALIAPGDIAIDATCGNGHDALFLAKLPLKKLYAIDLQEIAIENTRCSLERHLSPEEKAKVDINQMSHENLDHLLLEGQVKLIVYNLGYLPGSNKKVKTLKESTLISLKKSLLLLAKGGALSITCYPNHEEGKEEETAILEWAKDLPASSWEVRYHRWINRPPLSPSVLFIAAL